MMATATSSQPKFSMRPAGNCSKAAGERPHTWEHDGDGADLVAYGASDHGVSLSLGRCHDCGCALLSAGAYYSEHAERSLWFELAGAVLPDGG